MSAITLASATGTGAGSWLSAGTGMFAAQASLGSGVTAATIEIEGSADNSTPVLIATITLSGATTSDGVAFPDPVRWPFIRADVTSFTGTGTVTIKANIGT